MPPPPPAGAHRCHSRYRATVVRRGDCSGAAPEGRLRGGTHILLVNQRDLVGDAVERPETTPHLRPLAAPAEHEVVPASRLEVARIMTDRCIHDVCSREAARALSQQEVVQALLRLALEPLEVRFRGLLAPNVNEDLYRRCQAAQDAQVGRCVRGAEGLLWQRVPLRKSISAAAPSALKPSNRSWCSRTRSRALPL